MNEKLADSYGRPLGSDRQSGGESTQSQRLMAPITPRKPVLKDRFSSLFSTLKTQTYYDPAARGPGSHTYVKTKPLEVHPSLLFIPLTAIFQNTDHSLESHGPSDRHRLPGPDPPHLESRETSSQEQHRAARPHGRRGEGGMEPHERSGAGISVYGRDVQVLGRAEQRLC